VTSVLVPEGEGRWTEYPGGYADMLVQRGADLSRTEVNGKSAASEPKEAPSAGTAKQPPAAKRRLSFKEKHALETLPAEMAALNQKAVKLQERLADPDLYTRDRKAFNEASDALAEIGAKLGVAEERWLELEMLREELGG